MFRVGQHTFSAFSPIIQDIALRCKMLSFMAQSKRALQHLTHQIRPVSAFLTPADVQLGCGDFTTDFQTSAMTNASNDVRSDLAYCLSFANSADDFDKKFARLLDDRMRSQLVNSKHQLKKDSLATQEIRSHLDTLSLPRTMHDALRQTSRAIVITETEKPFRIFDVNQCWESLCGYTFIESQGRTLGSLLRGSETDHVAATAMISRVLAGDDAGATITNYTKSGRRFRNRVRVDESSHPFRRRLTRGSRWHVDRKDGMRAYHIYIVKHVVY